MSLEAKITELTEAIRELIAVTKGGAPAQTGTTETPKAEKPKAEAKKPVAEAASSHPGAEQETTAPAEAAPEADKELAYDDIKVPFLALISAKGRDVATKLLAEFGAAKLPEVKPEQFGAVLAAIQKAAA